MDAQWVALVGPEVEENLSLRYLASALASAGYRAELIALNLEHDFGRALATILEARTPPLLVGLSLSFQWRAPDVLALALCLRERGYRGHITGGGHFGTFAWRELLSDFGELDSICRQEAEATVVSLARALERGEPLSQVAGLSYCDAASGRVHENPPAPLSDLVHLSWPVRTGKVNSLLGHRVAPVVSSRGCYAHCSACCLAAWSEQALPGKRYRLRPVDELADELEWLHRDQGVDVFVFHDDNFFLPKKSDTLDRLEALAEELEGRGMSRFATVVKARPRDVTLDVFEVLQQRLRCVRACVDIETDSEQGLRALRRWIRPKQKAAALGVLRALGLLPSFNVLLFDPDTTVDSLLQSLSFLSGALDVPFNFGRAELYAGTPLLDRMRGEGRARGDYLMWNYSMATPEVERIFQIARCAFQGRNFAPGAVANAMMKTRLAIELARAFHPEDYRADWHARGADLSRRLGLHTVTMLRRALEHVVGGRPRAADDAFARGLRREIEAFDHVLGRSARELELRIRSELGLPEAPGAHDVTPPQQPMEVS